MKNNAQERPLSMAEWRKQSRRRDRVTALAIIGFLVLLVATVVVLSARSLGPIDLGAILESLQGYRSLFLLLATAFLVPVAGFFVVVAIDLAFGKRYRRLDDVE